MSSASDLTVDVVIAGLGAAGSAAAWRLASRGLRVAGFDAHEPPHTLGSSHGRSRIIREAYFEHPQYVPLVQLAYRLWEELEGLAGTRLFQATGGLMIGAPDSAVVAGTLRSAREHGLSVERWSAAEIRRRVPVLAPDDSMEGVFEPRAGVLAPERGVAAMAAAARALGAQLFVHEPVTGWRTDGPAELLVQTAARAVRTRALVLAAGPWMPGLLPQLPLAVERVVQHWYPPSGDDRFAPERFPVFLIEAPDGRVLYGLPDQGDGLKLAEHHHGTPARADAVDRHVSPEERARFHRLAARWVRGLGDGPADSAVCLYTNTPDGDFVLDWADASRSVYIASACSGHGFKFAPAIGQVVAAELAGSASPVDLTPFRLGRFGAAAGSPAVEPI
ncbi:MAG TPA: N-methyl-L-tryptophan oxidase [Vicinamibacterales bacterium]